MFPIHAKMLANLDGLSAIRERHAGLKIVHVHGVFDILHPGHLLHLENAKKIGDILVVTVTSDRYVNKGPDRPVFEEQSRGAMLANLEIIDYVAISDSPTAVDAINKLKPDYYVKGPDYRNLDSDVTGGIIEEKKAVESAGGQLFFTNDQVFSSSSIANRSFRRPSNQSADALAKVKETVSFERLVSIIENLKNLKVTVCGEPIIDRYIRCVPEGLSSKHASISCRQIGVEEFSGGSILIANQLAEFCSNVAYIGDSRGTNRLVPAIEEIADLNSKNSFITKTRYLNEQGHHLFEIAEFGDFYDDPHYADEVISNAIGERVEKETILLMADFGHGGIGLKSKNAFSSHSGYKILNVQSNSLNFGYNRVDSKIRGNFCTINLREARLYLNDKYAPVEDVIQSIAQNMPDIDAIAVTLGANGSWILTKECSPVHLPVFFEYKGPIISSGDRYLAISGLLMAMGIEPIIVGFLASVFSSIVPTKGSVIRKDQFIKAIKTLLA